MKPPSVIMVDTVPVNVADSVSLKDGDSSAHEQMLGVCRKTLPGWEQLTVDDVEASIQVYFALCK